MESLQEVKILVMSLVRTNTGGEMSLLELEHCYKEYTGTQLKSQAAKLGYESINQMIEDWPEFSVRGFSLSTTIRVKVQDHITELNQRKPGKNFKGFAKNYQECNPKKRYSGYDPYACSSPGSSDKSFKFEKYEHLVKPAVRLRPQPAKTNNILVPGKSPIVIVVQEMVNPHRFWFITYEEYKTIRRMMKKMDEFYNSDNQELHIKRNDLHPGHDVAVLFSDIWHRGRVIKMMDSGMIRIFFTDYGTVDDVALESVRVLVGKFLKYPECLKRGILSHVNPVNGIWPAVASERFGKKALNKKTEAKLRQVNDSDSSHVLAIRTMTEKLLLADELIVMDYCVCERDFGAIKSNSLAFADYEKGKHYEQPETQDEDSWSPTKPCATTSQQTNELAPSAEAKSSNNNQIETSSAVENRLKIVEKSQPKNLDKPQPDIIEQPRLKIVQKSQPKILDKPQPEIIEKPRPKILDKPQPKIIEQLQPKILDKPQPEIVEKPRPKILDKPQPIIEQPQPKIIGKPRPKILHKPQPEVIEQPQPKILDKPQPIIEQPQPKILDEPQPEIIGKPRPRPEAVPVKLSKRQADSKTQRLVKGAKEAICIYSIANDNIHFLFLLYSEFKDLRDFRDKLGSECEPNDDFSIGAHVVAKGSKNYFRGRIMNKIAKGDIFMIYLIDFGDIIERPRNLIYKLQPQWKDRPAAVLRGKLAESSQQSRLIEGRLKITEARIVEIDEDAAQLFLL